MRLPNLMGVITTPTHTYLLWRRDLILHGKVRDFYLLTTLDNQTRIMVDSPLFESETHLYDEVTRQRRDNEAAQEGMGDRTV